MKRKLWLPVIFLVISAIFTGGCTSPKAITPLTDKDKEEMVAIALADPDVSKWLEDTDVYSIEERWVVIAWEGSKAVGWYRVEYQDIKDGVPPSGIAYVTDDVTISPGLYFHIGEPARMFLSVIFDSKREKILSVEPQPGRPTAGPQQ